MDCPNCNFINMPSLVRCAHCGSHLVLHDVEVGPPRASHSAVPLRVRHALFSWRAFLRDEAGNSFASFRNSLQKAAPISAIAACILPGGGQFVLKQRLLGIAILSIWGLSLPLTLYLMGSGVVWIFYSMLIGAHCVSFSLIFSGLLRGFPLRNRAAFGLLIYGLLTLCIYWPASILVHRLIHPLGLYGIASNRLLQSDDVVWATGPWIRTSLKHGDIVARRIERSQAGGIVLREGIIVDRVIGIPGDHVVIKDGAIVRNGRTLTQNELPLRHCELVNVEYRLTGAEYLVVPSTFVITNLGQNGAAAMSRLAYSPESAIIGKVFFRTLSLSRAGPISSDTVAPPALPEAAP